MGSEENSSEASEIGLAQYAVIRYPGKILPAAYRNLILAKWMRSLKHGNDYFRLANANAFYSSYNGYILKLLERPETTVRLAVLAEDHDVVLGFSVVRGNVLDFVHVHKHQRRMGIGRSLIPDGIDTITHLTHTGLIIWGSKFPKWTFNPFA